MPDTKRPLDDFVNASTGVFRGAQANTSQDIRDFIVTAYGGLYSGAIETTDGDYTGVVGTLTVVDMSGWTTDNSFTLPVAANVSTGDRCGVMIAAGSTAYELDLLSGATNELINGVDCSVTSWSRLFIAGELVIFRCVDGSAGNWIVEYDGRIACASHMKMGTQSIASNTATVYDFDETDFDIGGIADLANNQMNIRRTGRYQVSFTGHVSSLSTNDIHDTYVSVDDVGTWLAVYQYASTGSHHNAASGIIAVNAGSYVRLVERHIYGSSRDCSGDLSIHEIL